MPSNTYPAFCVANTVRSQIDIKPTNILLEIDNSDDVISQYLSNVPPRIADVERGTPLREVFTTPPISQTARPHIRIIDFGVGKQVHILAVEVETNFMTASWRDNHLSDQIQPQALRAPEVTIGAPWDTGVDIWSLGCLVRASHYVTHHVNYSHIELLDRRACPRNHSLLWQSFTQWDLDC